MYVISREAETVPEENPEEPGDQEREDAGECANEGKFCRSCLIILRPCDDSRSSLSMCRLHVI